jgi:hypothetical protein
MCCKQATSQLEARAGMDEAVLAPQGTWHGRVYRHQRLKPRRSQFQGRSCCRPPSVPSVGEMESEAMDETKASSSQRQRTCDNRVGNKSSSTTTTT